MTSGSSVAQFLGLSAEAAAALALKHAQEGTTPAAEENKFEEDALEEEPLIGFLMSCLGRVAYLSFLPCRHCVQCNDGVSRTE